MINRNIKKAFIIALSFLTLFAKASAYESLPDSVNRKLSGLNDSSKIRLLLDLSWAKRNSEQVLSFKCAGVAIQVADSVNDHNGLAQGLNYLAIANMYRGDYQSANHLILKAIRISEEKNIAEQTAYSWLNFGHLKRFMKDYDQALLYTRKASQLHQTLNNNRGVAYSYIRFSEIFLELKQFDSALYYANEAVSIRRKLNDPTGINKALSAVGEAYVGLGQFKRALQIYVSILDNYDEPAKINIKLSKIYLILNKLNEAVAAGNLALQISEESQQYQNAMDAANVLADTYFKSREFEKAYLMLKKGIEYNAVIFSSEKSKNMALDEFEFKIKSNEDEMIRLKNDKKIGLILIYAFTVAFVLIVIAVYFLLRSRKTKINANILLQEKNDKISAQSAKLNELNATKDKFFSIIAHDLKNPLGSFMQTTDFLTKNFSIISPSEHKDFLDLMNESSIKVYTLLENLLEWARSQSKSIKFKPEEFNLFMIVDNLVDLLQINALSKKIDILNIISANTLVFADINMITTTIRNLATNAIKFTNPGGTITFTSRINENDETEICVSDNGIGMSPEVVNTLFKLKTGMTSLGTANEVGTGLGLVLCKEFVEKHGGRIWVKSEIGIGSSFYFTLPKHEAGGNGAT